MACASSLRPVRKQLPSAIAGKKDPSASDSSYLANGHISPSSLYTYLITPVSQWERHMVPVRQRALIGRVNRKLRADGKALMASRSGGAREDLGGYFVVGGGESPVGVRNLEA